MPTNWKRLTVVLRSGEKIEVLGEDRIMIDKYKEITAMLVVHNSSPYAKDTVLVKGVSATPIISRKEVLIVINEIASVSVEEASHYIYKMPEEQFIKECEGSFVTQEASVDKDSEKEMVLCLRI